MLEFLGGIINVFSLWDRLKKWRFPDPVVTNTAQRFIRLFESHGVARAQIPRFFGHGLTIHQVEDETELLKVLDGNLLTSAAELFGIQVEWLEGGSEDLYEIKHFYQQPEAFGLWLDAQLQIACGEKIDGWLLTSELKTDEYDALILMREKIGELADETIYRYHFCEQWIYGYWKCRADIAACVAQAWKRNCYISGRRIDADVFSALVSLKTIPDTEREATSISGRRFYAEDLTTDPDFYTHELDEGQFGKSSALSRWLSHNERGLMDSGFGVHGKTFNRALHEKH
jgi:hypothetical protein